MEPWRLANLKPIACPGQNPVSEHRLAVASSLRAQVTLAVIPLKQDPHLGGRVLGANSASGHQGQC